MSILIGRATPYRVRINKFLLFDMLSFVFKDFQILELLLKLSKKTYTLAVNNQDLLRHICLEKGMRFSLFAGEQPWLWQANLEYLPRVSLLKVCGHFTMDDGLADVEALGKLDPRKVFIESLMYQQTAPTQVVEQEQPVIATEYDEYYDEEEEEEEKKVP